MIFPIRVGGLEIDGDEVRLAVVNISGRLPIVIELHRAHIRYATPEARRESFVSTLRELVRKVKNRPSLYVLCLSGQNSIARQITVPFRGASRVSTAVPIELEPFLALPVEDLCIDYNVVREIDGKTEVLAVAMRVDALEEQLGLLNEAGINPECITVDSVGLAALWLAANKEGSTGLHVAFHIRENASVLVITRGKALITYRFFAIGSEQFEREPTVAARDVQNMLRGFSATHKELGELTTLHVTGVTLSDEKRQEFEDRISTPVQYENLTAKLKGFERALAKVEPLEAPSILTFPIADEPTETGPEKLGQDSEVSIQESAFGESMEALPEAADAHVAFDATAVEAEALPEIADALDVSDAAPEEAEPVEQAVVDIPGPIAGPGSNDWAGSIGVAVSYVNGSCSLDFRKGRIERRDDVRNLVRRAAFSAALLVLSLVGYGAYCYIDYTRNTAKVDEISKEMWEIYKTAFPQAEFAKGYSEGSYPDWKVTSEQMDQEIANQPQMSDDDLMALYAKPTLLDILNEIGKAMPGNAITLTKVSISGGKEQEIDITGEYTDDNALSSTMETIKTSTVFGWLEDPMRRSSEGKNTFQVKLKR